MRTLRPVIENDTKPASRGGVSDTRRPWRPGGQPLPLCSMSLGTARRMPLQHGPGGPRRSVIPHSRQAVPSDRGRASLSGPQARRFPAVTARHRLANGGGILYREAVIKAARPDRRGGASGNTLDRGNRRTVADRLRTARAAQTLTLQRNLQKKTASIPVGAAPC